MTEPQFRPGDRVRITIDATVRVEVPEEDGPTRLTYEYGPNLDWIGNTDLVNEGVTVEQLAPLAWPPHLYDVWGNEHGARWWAIKVHRSHPDRTEIALMDADGDEDTPVRVIQQSGPLFLVHREQTGGEG